jgi:hypothetical protein
LNRLDENDKVIIKDIIDVFKKLKLDSIELTCLKAIILFRFGNNSFDYFRNKTICCIDIRTLNKGNLIENLQDQAQITLAQFTQIHNPTRYFISIYTLIIIDCFFLKFRSITFNITITA